MNLHCEVCDRSIIENQSEYNKYVATLLKENDESLYKKILLIKLIWMKLIKYYAIISVPIKNILIFVFFNCEFVIEFSNNFIANIKTNYFYNTDFININKYLLYDNDCFKSRGHKFHNINQMTINLISHRCKMTY